MKSKLYLIPSSVQVSSSSKEIKSCYCNNTNLLKLSLIIPTYNEAQNIEKIVFVLTKLLDTILYKQYELIIVDDNSPDKTWQIAENLTTIYPQLKVILRCQERGLSTAVIRGWQTATSEILGVIDADLQHPPEVLLELWNKIEQGADLAVASRHLEDGGVSEWSLIRRFLSRGAQMLGLIILPEVISRVSDPMSGYFMVRRQAIVDKPLNPIGYKILIEILAKGSINWIGEVGYVFQERQAGGTKVTAKQYIEYIQHLLSLRWFLFPFMRFMRFGIVGLSGVFVDLGIFYLLRSVFLMALTRSAILSSEIAIINNFLWNDFWTFRDVSQKQKGVRQKFRRFLKFNLICLSGLVLNITIINILFNFLGVNEYLAKLIAIATVTFWNFWFNCKLGWKVTDL